jgi:hypothetical protein
VVQATTSTLAYVLRLVTTLTNANRVDYDLYQVMLLSLHMQTTADGWQAGREDAAAYASVPKLALLAQSVWNPALTLYITSD